MEGFWINLATLFMFRICDLLYVSGLTTVIGGGVAAVIAFPFYFISGGLVVLSFALRAILHFVEKKVFELHTVKPEDAVWLQETNENHCTVTTVITCSPVLSKERVCELLQERWLAREPKLSSRLVSTLWGTLHWSPISVQDTFKLCVASCTLPFPWEDAERRANYISEICSDPIPTNRLAGNPPLWRLLVLQDEKNQKTHLVLRTHHAVSDGISLASRIFLHLLDKPDEHDDVNADTGGAGHEGEDGDGEETTRQQAPTPEQPATAAGQRGERRTRPRRSSFQARQEWAARAFKPAVSEAKLFLMNVASFFTAPFYLLPRLLWTPPPDWLDPAVPARPPMGRKRVTLPVKVKLSDLKQIAADASFCLQCQKESQQKSRAAAAGRRGLGSFFASPAEFLSPSTRKSQPAALSPFSGKHRNSNNTHGMTFPRDPSPAPSPTFLAPPPANHSRPSSVSPPPSPLLGLSETFSSPVKEKDTPMAKKTHTAPAYPHRYPPPPPTYATEARRRGSRPSSSSSSEIRVTINDVVCTALVSAYRRCLEQPVATTEGCGAASRLSGCGGSRLASLAPTEEVQLQQKQKREEEEGLFLTEDSNATAAHASSSNGNGYGYRDNGTEGEMLRRRTQPERPPSTAASAAAAALRSWHLPGASRFVRGSEDEEDETEDEGEQMRCRILRMCAARFPRYLTIAVPISLRTQPPQELDNCQVPVIVRLPLGLQLSRLQRLKRVKEEMDKAKKGFSVFISASVLQTATSLLPAKFCQSLIDLYADKAALLLSNMAGPRRLGRLGGSQIEDVSYWPPTRGRVGVAVSMFSYGDYLRLMSVADWDVLPNPLRLVHLVADEIGKMKHEVAASAAALFEQQAQYGE
uniref:O-acyltransferase WSD1 C-terminal domain-containing protein n=1 Tax=Chromera velia CCMP2878 TaxID=1169474 RepID=A0A0G4F1D0_9ALVE|eukprot:Cvel_14595.t1-p1 / transcript=Cvel_14595.t1 / gene=Cvel_14595 / organism=Chromera_velia_CCMP2878 / gene_product=hypothetical protein / transcript_product=hypothetical protein / location=Cvel_scaffold1043:53674-57669(-) / protein_length=865 / sequence_SO=supercontig / SO=protein_coding / is_pseudo=false